MKDEQAPGVISRIHTARGMLAVRNLCKFKFLGSGATLAWLWRTPPQPRSRQGKRKSVFL